MMFVNSARRVLSIDGVEIYDEVHYGIPFGPLGSLLHALWIKKDLNHIFEYRKGVIDNLFKEKNIESLTNSFTEKVS